MSYDIFSLEAFERSRKNWCDRPYVKAHRGLLLSWKEPYSGFGHPANSDPCPEPKKEPVHLKFISARNI